MNNSDNIENFQGLINKYIKKNKINHCYLLETNYQDKIYLAKEIANLILKHSGSITLQELEKNGDLIIIDDNTEVIKTEEIEQIKENFITKSILGSKRIYIINNVENLNNYSANKLLKFIEEPEENIISILTTNNINNVINTIVSRCFNIRYFINKYSSDNYESEYLDKLFDFINNIENNKEKAIAFQNINSTKEVLDRSLIKKYLNDLLLVYDSVIQYKYTNNLTIFKEKNDIIKQISNNNDLLDIKRKTNAICDCIDKLKFNPNIKLLIDKLIIDMTGVDINA